MAPGPPVRIAPDAPIIFPVPTWAAMAVASGWKELIPLSCFPPFKEIVPNTFASVSNDETILIWKDSDSNIENVSSFDKFVTTVICPLKEGKFSFGRGNMIIILDINKKNYIQGFETNCRVEKISYIENRNTLISLLEDTTVILWDIDTNQQILSITLERKNLNCLMNSNIGDIIVMNDNSIIVNRNGKLVLLFNN